MSLPFQISGCARSSGNLPSTSLIKHSGVLCSISAKYTTGKALFDNELDHMWYRRANQNRWTRSIEEIMGDTLFHGTGEEFEGPLRGGGYDDVVWTANNPAVAQNYIPATGGKSGFSLDKWTEDDEIYNRFYWPKDTGITLLKQMGYGYPINTELYPDGTIKSFTYKDRPAKYGEIREYIRSLGYDPEEDFWLRSAYEPDESGETVETIKARDYKMPGRLFVGTAKEPLNIFDAYDYVEDGRAHNALGLFRKLRLMGYHGIKIPDYTQSENWGNVGHESVGIFPNHVDKVDWQIIPATTFDWQDDVRQFTTPEFEEWRNSQS